MRSIFLDRRYYLFVVLFVFIFMAEFFNEKKTKIIKIDYIPNVVITSLH